MNKDAKQAYEAWIKWYPMTTDDLDGEQWKPIPDYDGYQVSTFGRIKSFKRGKRRILKPTLDTAGYLFVQLYKNNKKNFRVHRLVAQLFIPNSFDKPEVNHRDGHKLNNHASNLEWVTSSENSCHAFDMGLQVAAQGESSVLAKLSNEQVRLIRENPEGLLNCKLADLFGVSRTTISRLQCGKGYESAGGSIRQAKAHKYTKRLPDAVRNQIRAEYQKGVVGCGSVALAKKYGITHTTILSIIKEQEQ